MWQLWTAEIGCKEARGEAFYTMLFDAAPSLQLLFKTSKSVTAAGSQLIIRHNLSLCPSVLLGRDPLSNPLIGRRALERSPPDKSIIALGSSCTFPGPLKKVVQVPRFISR